MKKPICVPKILPNATTAQDLVVTWEQAFDRRLNEVAESISFACIHEGVQMLRLSGPSCAGKTTTAAKLEATLEAAGRSVYPISLDDFFHGKAYLQRHATAHNQGKLDYDSVDALDLETLHACVHDLLTKGRAEMPVFDFKLGDRKGYYTMDTTKDKNPPVFLFEGIQAVYPQVVAMLGDVPQRSVFISVETPIMVGDVLFEPNEIRLMRRLVRDEAKRNATPAFTLMLWHSVRANEENAIFPYAKDCDIHIDSAMGFDVHMLAPHLRRLLDLHPVTGEDAVYVKELMTKLQGVEGISHHLLSPNSLYHEFILA